MPTRLRREKRIHRQHDEQCCRWILFLWKRKARTRCAGEKRGKRAGGGASRAPHRREGTESGVAWNEKERRCVTKRAENRKGTRRIEKAHGRIEKQGIAESKRRSRNSKECGGRNPKACGRGFRRRAICPPPCRDEEFG